MDKPKLYYYLSIVSIVLTFTTGFGILASLILLVIIASEKDKLSNKYLVGNVNALETLRKARKLNKVNLIINAVFFVILAIALIFILVYTSIHPSRLFGA